MNVSTSLMTSVPFSGTAMTATLVVVCVTMACIAAYAVMTSLKERRAAQLEMANANPELEAFGLPMPVAARKRNMSVDTGATLKSEGFAV